MGISGIFVLAEITLLCRADGLLLFNRKTFHQPPELLPCDRFCFRFTARPLEGTVFKSFIEKDKTVPFPQKCFHTVSVSSAKEEQCL